MTAIFLLKTDDAAHIATDSAVLNERGEVISHVCKAMPIPRINAAVAVRGAIEGLTLALLILGRCGGYYDAVKANVGAALRKASEDEAQAQRNLKAILETGEPNPAARDFVRIASELQPLSSPFEIWCAGWSETTGPDCFVVGNHGHTGLTPFEVLDVEYSTGTPVSDMSLLIEASGKPPVDATLQVFGHMRCQRETSPSITAPDWRGCICGGDVTLTTVRQDEITTGVVAGWRDPIGRQIAVLPELTRCDPRPRLERRRQPAGGPPSGSEFRIAL